MSSENRGYRKRGDEPLLLALASGCSIRAAARKTGRAEITVGKRLQDPEFRERLDDLRRDMLDRAVGRLAATLTAAANTLRKLLKAKSEMARLSAARAILELHSRLKADGELEQRLAAVEAFIKSGEQ